jgi:hypothetical protein
VGKLWPWEQVWGVAVASRKPVVIITYNGVDGACAAAMALLAFPKANLVISSARAIACGLVVELETMELASAAPLRQPGVNSSTS